MCSPVTSAQSAAIERSSVLSLLQAVHASFPLATLEHYSSAHLRHDERSNVDISGIFTSGATLSTTLSVAQEAFCQAVQHGSALQTPAANVVNFYDEGSARNADKIDVDCVVELQVPAGSFWTRDPASDSDIFHIRPTGHELLTPARSVAVTPAAPAAAAGAAVLDLRRYPPACFFDGKSSSDTAMPYSPGSTHYVIGESFGPLNLGKPDASTAMMPKLLRLERILCVIQTKDGVAEAADICSCVLGVVLIGPSMDSATCAAVFTAISCYKALLQRLWALYKAKRLLAIRLSPLETELQQDLLDVRANLALAVAEDAAVRAKVETIRKEVAEAHEEGAAIRAEVAAMRTDFAEISAKLDTILARQAADDAAAVGGVGGVGGLHRGGGGGNQHGGGRRRRHRHGRGRGGGQCDAGGQ